MSEDEYIEVTDREKLRIAYNILRDISGGCGPITEEWLKDILIKVKEMLKQVDARRLVYGPPARELLVESKDE